MKLLYKELEIRMQSGAAIIRKAVPAWEAPLLQAIHEEVTELRDVVRDDPAPSVSQEFSRLAATYGAERKEGGFTGIPYVEAVYGSHGVGMAALKRAMQDSVLPKDTALTPVDAPPTLRKDLLQELQNDILSGDLIGGEPQDQDELEEV